MTAAHEDYKFANLNDSELKKLREIEGKLKMESGKDIILLAYAKE